MVVSRLVVQLGVMLASFAGGVGFASFAFYITLITDNLILQFAGWTPFALYLGMLSYIVAKDAIDGPQTK